jgi:signal transduction histidine kinase
VYVVVARLGLMMDAVSGFATLVWPATGLTLVAFVMLGYRIWPGVALGALLTNLGVGAPPLVALGIALGNTLEGVVGAWALRRLTGGLPWLGRVRDVLAFIGAAAMASTLISATLGVASLALGGVVPAAAIVPTWSAWWVGDVMGDLIVAPPLFLLVLRSRSDWARELGPRPRSGEAALLGVLILATNVLVFGPRDGGSIREAYMVFPLLVWAGLRFGVRGAAWANLAVSSIAVCATALGRGPFYVGSLSVGLLHMQAFMIIVAITTLLLGSVSEERRQAIALRDSLISLASHELRTPLTSLQLRIQLLSRSARAPEPPRDRLARDVSGAEDQVRRMARLVDDLLDISRIMAGRLRLDIEDVELDRLVQEIVDRCPEPQRDLVRIQRSGEPIVGRWDRMRIDQIVSNLLSNALKYGENKPIEITLDRHDDRARIQVRDRGVGIAAADLSRIFERFERAAAKHVGGFGLGLWIVRQVVDALGGSIGVESRLGAGSVFTVELPLEPPGRDVPGAAPGYPGSPLRA